MAMWSDTGFTLLGATAINLELNSNSAFIDLASDYLGPVRFAVTTTDASTADTVQDDNYP